MNKTDRKRLLEMADLLGAMSADLQDMMMEEESKIDAMPESISMGERGERMREAIDCLNSAKDNIDSAVSDINEAVEV